MEKIISWVEIPTSDFDRAVKFYSQIFKTELKGENLGIEKMVCLPSGEGAIIFHPEFKPSENGLIVSIQVVDNIDSTLERIASNGGKILKPKTKIDVEGKGYFALFLDSEGNRLGLYEN